MTTKEEKLELIKKNLKSYPDFPKQGVIFRDIFSVLANPQASEALYDLIIAHCAKYIPKDVEAVCALDSRGFLFGPFISHHFHIPFIPIRKKSKLPGDVNKESYDLEYGSETLEIQKNALSPNTSVLLVDDLIATGGSLLAGCKLINSIGSKVHHSLVIIELEQLKGRQRLSCPLHALLQL